MTRLFSMLLVSLLLVAALPIPALATGLSNYVLAREDRSLWRGINGFMYVYDDWPGTVDNKHVTSFYVCAQDVYDSYGQDDERYLEIGVQTDQFRKLYLNEAQPQVFTAWQDSPYWNHNNNQHMQTYGKPAGKTWRGFEISTDGKTVTGAHAHWWMFNGSTCVFGPTYLDFINGYAVTASERAESGAGDQVDDGKASFWMLRKKDSNNRWFDFAYLDHTYADQDATWSGYKVSDSEWYTRVGIAGGQPAD